jgi:site-specific DNA-methyltransferase (adenine-specific)
MKQEKNKIKNPQLFTSKKQDWQTPKELYEELNKEFDFDFDPCPYDREDWDGLYVEWGKSNFVNPPYKSNIQDMWIEKGFLEWKKGKTVVFLLPARTDTKRFHDFILPYATEIRFIKGRLHFSDHKNPATFPSMIVVFKENETRRK